MSKRFASRFDSRPASAAAEFEALVEGVGRTGAALYVSYATGGSVPVERLLRMMRSRFAHVEVFASEVRHHSQGRAMGGRGRRIEVLLAGVHR